ncbi:MAG: hypothetical protein JW810_12535 [Sedimentisphaerales bacterium]|nr:hypothetical protein [Sedimentisphaerales bacterium]
MRTRGSFNKTRFEDMTLALYRRGRDLLARLGHPRRRHFDTFLFEVSWCTVGTSMQWNFGKSYRLEPPADG